jgi:hypothetical protein
MAVGGLLWRACNHGNIAMDIVKYWPTFQVPLNARPLLPFDYSTRNYFSRPAHLPRYPHPHLRQYWEDSHEVARRCATLHWGHHNYALWLIYQIARTCKDWYCTVSRLIPDLHSVMLRRIRGKSPVPHPIPITWPLQLQLFGTRYCGDTMFNKLSGDAAYVTDAHKPLVLMVKHRHVYQEPMGQPLAAFVLRTIRNTYPSRYGEWCERAIFLAANECLPAAHYWCLSHWTARVLPLQLEPPGTPIHSHNIITLP